MEREITKRVGRRHVDSSARYPIRRRRVSYKQCSQIGLCPCHDRADECDAIEMFLGDSLNKH